MSDSNAGAKAVGLAAALTAFVGLSVLSGQMSPDTGSRRNVVASQIINTGSLSLTGEQTSTVTGTQNDFALTAQASTLTWNGASPVTFTGFAGGTSGRVLLIVNVSATTLTLNTESGSSTAANRLTLLGGTSQVVGSNGAAFLRYDGANSRWRVIAINSSQFGATLTATANITFSSFQAPGSISGTVNDWAPTAGYRYRTTASALATITGLATGVSGGRLGVIQNVGSFSIILAHENTGSSAANRFVNPSSADVVIPPGASAIILYDSGVSRWLVTPGIGCYSQASNTLFGSSVGILRSGEYYWAINGSTSTSVTLGNGTLRVAPMWVPNTVTLTRIGVGITVGGDATAKVRLGVYGDDGTGKPGALLLDAGQVDAAAAGDPELTISLTVGPGWYWVGGAVQGVTTTQPTVRILTTHHSSMPLSIPSGLPAGGILPVGYSISGITGALPNPFGTAAFNGATPRLFVKT